MNESPDHRRLPCGDAEMQSVMSDQLEDMWTTHRDYLRRFLISLSRDIDLADDLLQESYLKAREGFGGYRGGEPRAWLASIARNAFYSHLRLRYVRSESPLSEHDALRLGPVEQSLDLIEIRRAMADLPKAQRDALVMKHYGGYSYEDIATHMNCAVGTAKSRVGTAIRRLRVALMPAQEEPVEMECAELSERVLLDFVYGRSPDADRKRVEAHLKSCPSCRARAAEVGRVLHALDSVEAETKGTGVFELHGDATATVFLFVTHRNDAEEARQTLDIGADFAAISSVLVNGEEAVIEPVPGRELEQAKLRLARPLAQGEQIELLMVGRSQVPEEAHRHVGDGVRKFGPGKLIFDTDTLFEMAVRLPQKAAFVRATPEATEVRTNGATTVVWRKLHHPDEEFEFWVEYRV